MTSPPAPRLPLILLRLITATVTLLALLQVMLAGSFLNGTYDSLKAHEGTAMTLSTALLVQLVVAVLVRWPGRGPQWPLWSTAGLTAAVVAQILSGYGRALGVHVTLGVLTVSGVLFVLAGAWRLPLPAPAGPRPAEEDGAGRLPRPGGPVEVAR
ncbi:hypothetical protein ACIBCA_09390 [Kitasatospora sp. NPDC051170]|uniref:hypothetical protein n=1 Tax=Kitasatospora sp. NPDC051170 TaxID=3364056 RepID=UPI00379C6EB6